MLRVSLSVQPEFWHERLSEPADRHVGWFITIQPPMLCGANGIGSVRSKIPHIVQRKALSPIAVHVAGVVTAPLPSTWPQMLTSKIASIVTS